MKDPVLNKISDEKLQQYVIAFYKTNAVYDEIPAQEGINLFQQIFQNSRYLIAEPELVKLTIDPGQLIEIYHYVDQQIMDKFGNPNEMTDSVFDTISEEIIKLMVIECFSESLRLNIVKALYELLSRAENNSDSKLMADCAANLFILRKKTFSEVWSSMVICDAIVRRSMESLYAIPDVFEKYMLITEDSASTATAKSETAESETPENTARNIWISGLDSIMNGSLVFDVCQSPELEYAAKIMEKFSPDSEKNSDADNPAEPFAQCLADDVIPFMLKQITLAKIKKIQSVTELYLNDIETTAFHRQFLTLLKTELQSDNPEIGTVQILWNACVAKIRVDNL